MSFQLACHPALTDLLPQPRPASEFIPEWLRDMPSTVEDMAFGTIRTLKHCPPILDGFQTGIIFPLSCDIEVCDEGFSWDWNFPILPDDLLSRGPLGLHMGEQLAGAPFKGVGEIAIKFTNYWTIKVPSGFSVLFTHPLNRPDLPFQTLSAVVDCDRFCDGYVHFPALWVDRNFRGTLSKGTPIVQAFLIPRAGHTMSVSQQNIENQAKTRALQSKLTTDRAVYRKDYRHKDGLPVGSQS